MNRIKLKKQVYTCPMVENIHVEVEGLMVEASGDHEHIGQGGTFGDAKQDFFSNDEDNQPWSAEAPQK